MSSRVQLKVVLLGQMDCGKTCLVTRYMSGTFLPRSQTTIGAAFCQRNVRVRQRNIVVGIWDTAGMEQFRSMSSQYYRGAKAAVVCYDVTVGESFGDARFWIKEVQKSEPNCKVYLCGCKVDLVRNGEKRREVDEHNAADFAEEYETTFTETSSKTGENVDKLFLKIVEDYADLLPSLEEDESAVTALEESNKSAFSKCPC
ncbi:ras-related protein Rab-24-like [Oscarella lobularis]|uniref:ras-related protein Rab-24-like n=1 Tax=Oscarella lobularis TaxID=121494 RepID=UPI0033141586